MAKVVITLTEDRIILTQLAAISRQNKIAFLPASSTQIAWAMIRSIDVDMFILDEKFDNGSAHAFYKELKHSPRTAPIPVMLLSEPAGTSKLLCQTKLYDVCLQKSRLSEQLLPIVRHQLAIQADAAS